VGVRGEKTHVTFPALFLHRANTDAGGRATLPKPVGCVGCRHRKTAAPGIFRRIDDRDGEQRHRPGGERRQVALLADRRPDDGRTPSQVRRRQVPVVPLPRRGEREVPAPLVVRQAVVLVPRPPPPAPDQPRLVGEPREPPRLGPLPPRGREAALRVEPRVVPGHRAPAPEGGEEGVAPPQLPQRASRPEPRRRAGPRRRRRGVPRGTPHEQASVGRVVGGLGEVARERERRRARRPEARPEPGEAPRRRREAGYSQAPRRREELEPSEAPLVEPAEGPLPGAARRGRDGEGAAGRGEEPVEGQEQAAPQARQRGRVRRVPPPTERQPRPARVARRRAPPPSRRRAPPPPRRGAPPSPLAQRRARRRAPP